MQYFEFNKDEKAEMFDEIASRYYNRNFGQMSKTDECVVKFNKVLFRLIVAYARENVRIKIWQQQLRRHLQT